MTQEVRAHCFTCHREEIWSVENNEILSRRVWLDGGVRQPDVHPQLAAWRVVKAVRAKKIWRIIEPCPACTLPFAAKQTRQVPMEWPLTVGDETYFAGPDLNTGPSGPIHDDALDTLLTETYRERFDAKILISPKTWFQASLFTVFLLVFITWLTGAFCLSQFYVGIFNQGFSPSP